MICCEWGIQLQDIQLQDWNTGQMQVDYLLLFKPCMVGGAYSQFREPILVV